MANIPVNIHQALLDRCREGDSKAQFEIYKLYYRSMYNASLRIIQEPGEAEDIMQESFLAAFEKLNDYQGVSTFGAWLKRIVVNRSLDRLRRKKMFFEELTDELMVTESEPEPGESFPFSIESVKAAMSRLSPGYRTILSLILFEGYDHEEVSEILGISNSTSRTQFSRARNRLQTVLLTEQHSKN